MAIQNNRISLGNAVFTPATFQGAAFTPQQENMSLLQHSIDKLDERKEKTDQQTAIITKALGEVQLNEKDSLWKADYINKIKSKINSAAQFGDYSAALEIATRLAGEAIEDPEFRGREKANIQYQNWKKGLDESVLAGRIDKRTADRLKEENVYRFVPLVDDSGNTVGFRDWETVGGLKGGNIEQAVNKVSLEALFDQVDKIVAERKGAGSRFTARDSSGKITDLYGKNISTLTKKSSTYAYKDKDVLQGVFDELVTRHPELTAYLEQMKKDDEWEIKKLEQSTNDPNADPNTLASDKQKLKDLKKGLYSENGLGIKSTKDYLFYRSNKSISAMSYHNYFNDTSIQGGGTSGDGPDSSNPKPKNTVFGGEGKPANYKPKIKPTFINNAIQFVKSMLNSDDTENNENNKTNNNNNSK